MFQAYTVLQFFAHVLFLVGNQGSHQNFDLSIVHTNQETLTDSLEDEAKKILGLGGLKKTEFFNSANSQYFLQKFQG